MKRILSQCHKELAQFKRDRLTLSLAFFLPLLTLLIFGFAIRLEAKNIPLFVQDFDNTPLSRSYIERLFATNQFIPIYHPFASKDLPTDPEMALDEGVAKVAVIIPPDFSRRIKSELVSDVQVIVDGTDVNNARVIQNSIKGTTNRFLRDSKLQTFTNKIMSKVRLWFNPGRKESLYIIPGLYGLILWVYPSLLTAVATIREKSQGTIIQVYASDLSATEFILGKGLAYLLIGILEAILIMVSGWLIWSVNWVENPLLFLLGTLVFLADSVMFGLLVGLRAGNEIAAIQAVALLGFLTALLLSGFIYPLSNIPFPLSLVSYIVPARYYMEISRDAYVRGSGWTGVGVYFLALILLGLLLFRAAKANTNKMQLPD